MFKKMIAALLIALTLSAYAHAEAQPIDINTATAEQLAEFLTGVGEAKAKAIVQYREEHGAFKHPDELVNVRGIGLATVDRNRDRIVVDTPAEPQS